MIVCGSRYCLTTANVDLLLIEFQLVSAALFCLELPVAKPMPIRSPILAFISSDFEQGPRFHQRS